MRIPHSRPTIDERDINSVVTNLESGLIADGSEVSLFEQDMSEYVGVLGGVATNSGTNALHLALKAQHVKPGDEVITTPFTFIATVEVIKLLGLKPVFVDVKPDTFNLDQELLEIAINERTRAIVPVHLFGQCAHMEAIMDLAKRKGLPVVEAEGAAADRDNGGRLKPFDHAESFEETPPALQIGDERFGVFEVRCHRLG